MSKPEDISQDVWDAAETAFDLMLCNCIEASGTTEQFRVDSITPLARAILAERARCFDRAFAFYTGWKANPGADDSGAIALSQFMHATDPERTAAIRAGSE